MLLSTLTGPLYKYYDDKEIIRIIAGVGFDAYDSSLCVSMRKNGHPFAGDNFLEYAKKIRKYSDDLGIVCNQAHAPFHSSCGDDVKDEEIFREIVRSMEIASILGAKIIVVHPKQHLTYADNAEKLFDMNMEFYNRLIPYCKNYNIKVAAENMWQYNSASGAITDSTCSRAFEFNKYLDTLDSEWIVGCLDIGHVSLVTKDIPGFIHKMGKKRIKALHIHDTDFIHDSHTLPFIEKIDFSAVTNALKEIGYDGGFTFETDNIYRYFPKELYPSVTKLLHDTGRYLMSEILK